MRIDDLSTGGSLLSVVLAADEVNENALDRLVAAAAAALGRLDGSQPPVRRFGNIVVLGRSAGRSPILLRSVATGQGEWLEGVASITSDRLEVEADSCGLSQVSWAEVDGITVVSNSALVVAVAIGAGLDESSVAMLAHLGFLIGGRTLFSGVRRLQAGERLEVPARGRPRMCSSTAPPTGASSDRDEVSGEGASVLSAAAGDLVEAFPDASLELSGGLDSRAVLAAIPSEVRRGMRAVTLGRRSDPDARVAERLARLCGLDWHLIDQSGLHEVPPAELMSMAETAACHRDACVNALAALTLGDAERRIPEGPRFTGANGEFARGFYYAGVLTDGGVTSRRVAQLARWRLFTNDGTAATALRQPVAEHGRELTLAAVEASLGSSGGWRASLDEFYLTGRMANWAGPNYLARAPGSVPLAPFFHGHFLDWARSMPRAARLRNRTFARMVQDLDPAIAAVPLDRGPSVTELARGGLRPSLRSGAAVGHKVVAKIDQRLRHRPRPPTLAVRNSERLQRGWSGDHTTAVADTGLFRSDVVEALDAGRSVDSAILSLAINIAAAQRFLDTAGETEAAQAADSSSSPISRQGDA